MLQKKGRKFPPWKGVLATRQVYAQTMAERCRGSKTRRHPSCHVGLRRAVPLVIARPERARMSYTEYSG